MADKNSSKDPSLLYDEEFMKKREEMFSSQNDAADVSSGRQSEPEENEEAQNEADEFEDFDAEKKESGSLFSRFKRSLKKRREYDDDDDDGYDIFDLDEMFDDEPKHNEQKPDETDRVSVNEQLQKQSESLNEQIKKQQKDLEQKKKKEKRNKVPQVKPQPKKENPRPKKEEPKEEKSEAAFEPDFVPAPEPNIKPDFGDFAPEGEATTYAVDDINALLESVGIKPLSASASDEPEVKEKNPPAEEELNEKTRDFSKESTTLFDETPDSSTKRIDTEALKEVSSKKSDVVSSTTRLFNISKLFSQKGKVLSEGETEEKLRSKRKRFIDNFRVLEKTAQDKPILERINQPDASASVVDIVSPENGEGIFDAVEKADKENNSLEEAAIKAAAQEKTKEKAAAASALCKKLSKQNAKEKTRMIILAVLCGIALILSFMASGYKDGGALGGIFGSGARPYVAVCMLLLVGAAALCFDRFKESIESLKQMKINSSVAMLLICAFVLLHEFICLITGITVQSGMFVYSAYAIFVMLMLSFSSYVSNKTLIKNLSAMIHAKDGLLSLCAVDSKSDAAALAHGIAGKDDPNIFYFAKTDIPDDLDLVAGSDSFDEKLYGYGGVAVMALALVLSIVLSVTGKAPAAFASCFVGGICLCFPLFKAVANERLLYDCASSNSPKGSCVCGLEPANMFTKSNAVVVDSADLFEARVSKFRVVPGRKIAQSDAVVFAASTLKNTKSLLSSCFDEFLEQTGIELPEAEDVQYEERLGYSSWVAQRRVLVGKREMLVAHSIACPTEEEEQQYSKGRNVMYVAVEGNIVATFIVGYFIKGEIKKEVSRFGKTGIVLMLSNFDPCLSEKFVAQKLSTDIAMIKFIGSNAGAIIEAYQKNPTNACTGLVCTRKHKQIFNLVNASYGLGSAQKLSQLLDVVGVAVMFVIFAFCMFLGTTSVLTPVFVMAAHAAWCAVSYFVGKTRL